MTSSLNMINFKHRQIIGNVLLKFFMKCKFIGKRDKLTAKKKEMGNKICGKIVISWVIGKFCVKVRTMTPYNQRRGIEWWDKVPQVVDPRSRNKFKAKLIFKRCLSLFFSIYSPLTQEYFFLLIYIVRENNFSNFHNIIFVSFIFEKYCR